MFTKQKIKDSLLVIIEGIRNPPAVLNFINLPYTRDRIDNLVNQCIALHREVEGITDESDTWSATQKLFLIEAEYKKLRARLMLLPSIFLIYFGFIAVFFILKFVNFTGFIQDVLRVDAPERLITFGLSGAFLYLATEMLSSISAYDNKDAVAKIADFTIRILLAIVVPILLVALFFTSDGEIADVKISPEIIAFACGYSAKLVVEVLNKIVEKASKMLNVL